MTILRSGSTDKYSQNWAAAFEEKRGTGKKVAVKGAAKPKAKKQAKAAKSLAKTASPKRR